MKKIIHILRYMLPTIGVLAVMSCTRDELDITPVIIPQEGTAEVSFMADLPSAIEVSTRGEVGTVPENTISDVYVLAFETSGSKDLVYKAKGRSLAVVSGSENNNRVTFKATLPVGKAYTFMVLANAESKLGGIAVGASPAKTKADVLALTQTLAAGSKWNSTSPAIPMWGEQELTLSGSSSPVFVLTRMLARVNVEFNPKEVGGITPENFRLASVRYYNYNTAGTLVSAEGNYTASGNDVTVTAPTIPASPGTQTGGALVYDSGDITAEKSCKNKIYIFEAAHNGNTYNTPSGNSAWINNPCLVVGGQYSPDNGATWGATTYYRIDFIRKDLTDPDNPADVWLSVLRNFSYNVTITLVSGDGYGDPDVALKSAPINMEANVLDWKEGGMGEIVFDGVFYLSVSHDEFVLQRNASDVKGEDNVVYIKTDYVYNNDPASTKSGWKVDRYESIDGTVMSEQERWLELVPSRDDPDVRTEAYFKYETNEGTANREAYVWIAAGRLRYRIHVVQRVLSLDIVDPNIAGLPPITEMRFVVPRTGDRTHEPRPFQVRWTPIGEDVTITGESPQSWNPFEPDWLSPNPETQGWTITGGQGTLLYTVQPPAVTDAELGLDPFYERETTYYFEVDNGNDSEKKGINLHQIYYNIIVDTYTYRLDGKTYTLSVRSNADWKITKIEEWLYNTDPATLAPGEQPTSPVMLQLNTYDNLKVGTTGGPNTSGVSVAFTVVNQEVDAHRNKWGTIWVTFENPDGKYPPERVALSFPPRNITMLGLGYARDVRAFNVAIPTSYHLQSASRMFTNQLNFGNTDESVVQVDHFRVVGYNCEGYSSAPSGGAADNANWRTGFLANWLNMHKPDVIVMTYSMQLNSTEAALLRQYLDNGGSVIMYYGGDVQTTANVKTVMDAVFGKSFSSTSDIYLNSGGGAVYAFEDIPTDPILGGPFGDIAGKYWGNHLSHVAIRETALDNQVEVLSRASSNVSGTGLQSSGFVNIFRHKTLNFAWIGNAMGTASYYPEINETIHDPIRIDSEDKPAVRENFGPGAGNLFSIYNSYLLANMVAWGISVSNHIPPPAGY